MRHAAGRAGSSNSCARAAARGGLHIDLPSGIRRPTTHRTTSAVLLLACSPGRDHLLTEAPSTSSSSIASTIRCRTAVASHTVCCNSSAFSTSRCSSRSEPVRLLLVGQLVLAHLRWTALPCGARGQPMPLAMWIFIPYFGQSVPVDVGSVSTTCGCPR